MSRNAAKDASGLVRIEPICVGRDDAARLLGIGVSTLELHTAKGLLPKPRQLGGRAVWLVAELRRAAEALPVSELLPPAAAQMAKGKAKIGGAA